MNPLNDEMKKEVAEITKIFLSLPKVDRVILLNNAVAFQTLRKIENNAKSQIQSNEKAGQEVEIHMKKENNPKEQTTIRLTVRIPDELEKQVRDEAERRGLSINQMMIQMVTRYLKDHQD